MIYFDNIENTIKEKQSVVNKQVLYELGGESHVVGSESVV